MIVKQDKKWNIPWRTIGMGALLFIIISGVAMLISFTISSKAESNKVKKLAREKETKAKIIDLVSKKYYVSCSKNIISPDKYKLVKVSNRYRIVVGNETKSLDDTFAISDCGVMYDVSIKNLRFEE